MNLGRRLHRLERRVPEVDPHAGLDRLIAALPTDELRLLRDAYHARDNGLPVTAEQAAACARFDERLGHAGIAP
jgi:hypothetical protein